MRTVLSGLLAVAVAAPGLAQVPGEPRALPPSVVLPAPGSTPAQSPNAPQGPGAAAGGDRGVRAPAVDDTVRLPRAEQRLAIRGDRLTVWRAPDGWQVLYGKTPLRAATGQMTDADDVRRAVAGTLATEWGTLGKPAALEYGLTDAAASLGTPELKRSAALDLKTLRVEEARGVFLLRDDGAIHANFGRDRVEAEQGAAVARRYGFNRVGIVKQAGGEFRFLYYSPFAPEAGMAAAPNPLAALAAEQELARTGIPIPGTTSYVGERVSIDPRKASVRRDRAGHALVSGETVLATFGPNDWAARDALRLVQECRFTDYCTVGGCSFFLVNGQAPTRVPFSVQQSRFDPAAVKAGPVESKFAVFDGGNRRMFDAATAEEAEQIVRVIKAYGFDTLCQAGPNPRAALRYLAKTERGR